MEELREEGLGSTPSVNLEEIDVRELLNNPKELLKKLFEVGAHYGHRKSRWNPRMKPFIYTVRNGIHVIDVRYTVVALRKAYERMREEGRRGGTVLFVSTKPQARAIIKEEARRVGAFYVVERWPGGLLTNFETIHKRILKMKEYESLFLEFEERRRRGEVLPYTKKEILKMQREYAKLRKLFGGIENMNHLPDLVYIVDPKYNHIAAYEVKKLGIYSIGMVDTNADPEMVDLPIPANDESMKSIRFITHIVAQGYLDGKREREAAGGVLPEEAELSS